MARGIWEGLFMSVINRRVYEYFRLICQHFVDESRKYPNKQIARSSRYCLPDCQIGTIVVMVTGALSLVSMVLKN